MFQTRERLSQREDEAIEIRSTISVLFVLRTEKKSSSNSIPSCYFSSRFALAKCFDLQFRFKLKQKVQNSFKVSFRRLSFSLFNDSDFRAYQKC